MPGNNLHTRASNENPDRIYTLSMSQFASLAALALLFTLPQHELRFAPQDGTRCTKTYETRGTLRQTVRGLEDDEEPFEMPVSIARTIRIADQYVQSEAGRPLRLKRVFEQASSRLESTIEGTSEEDANNRVTKNLSSQVEGVKFPLSRATGAHSKKMEKVVFLKMPVVILPASSNSSPTVTDSFS